MQNPAVLQTPRRCGQGETPNNSPVSHPPPWNPDLHSPNILLKSGHSDKFCIWVLVRVFPACVLSDQKPPMCCGAQNYTSSGSTLMISRPAGALIRYYSIQRYQRVVNWNIKFACSKGLVSSLVREGRIGIRVRWWWIAQFCRQVDLWWWYAETQQGLLGILLQGACNKPRRCVSRLKFWNVYGPTELLELPEVIPWAVKGNGSRIMIVWRRLPSIPKELLWR